MTEMLQSRQGDTQAKGLNSSIVVSKTCGLVRTWGCSERDSRRYKRLLPRPALPRCTSISAVQADAVPPALAGEYTAASVSQLASGASERSGPMPATREHLPTLP